MEYSLCKHPRPGRRVASYARFSSHNQRSESIEIQHDNNLAYCAIEDLDVVAIYSDEARSGRTTDRADFQRMVADAKMGLFDYVVIYKVTRIMRNRDEMALLRVTLKKSGVQILYSGENIGKGSDAILQLGLKEVLAEWESAQLGERIVDGIQKNAERCMANGQTRYGWDIVDGYYQVNEAEAAVLRRAKDMLLAGSTLAEIVRALKGHVSKRGRAITQSTLTKLLKRKQNAGVYSYAGYEKKDGMPALWSMKEQRMIWELLGENLSPHRKGGSADFLLTGKLWCGKCESPMTGTSGTGKSGKVYYYYKDKKGCGRQVRKDLLEESVAEAVIATLAKEETRERIADLMCEYEEESDETPQSAVIEAELKEIHLAYERVWKAIEQGIAPPGGKERMEEMRDRELLLEEELAVAKSIEAVRLDRDRVLFALELIAEEADPKRLISMFVSKVVLMGDDELHIVMYFDDEGKVSPLPPGGGGGVLSNGPMLHH